MSEYGKTYYCKCSHHVEAHAIGHPHKCSECKCSEFTNYYNENKIPDGLRVKFRYKKVDVKI